jgi:hypothetical protein
VLEAFTSEKGPAACRRWAFLVPFSRARNHERVRLEPNWPTSGPRDIVTLYVPLLPSQAAGVVPHCPPRAIRSRCSRVPGPLRVRRSANRPDSGAVSLGAVWHTKSPLRRYGASRGVIQKYGVSI